MLQETIKDFWKSRKKNKRKQTESQNDSKVSKLDNAGENVFIDSENVLNPPQYPDFPKRKDFGSEEEFKVSVDKFYQENDLRNPKDFTEEEKKSIVEDITVNSIAPQVLTEKYKTTVMAIRHFVHEKGLKMINPDSSWGKYFSKKYKSFPRKFIMQK